jgi:acyl carrier protein
MSDTASALLAIFQENIPGLQLDPAVDGDRPLTEVGVDSLDKMSILLAVQEKWNREFSEEEIAALVSFNDICRQVGAP